MSATVNQHEWDYIAHVQKGDGTTVELAGTILGWTDAAVYQKLLQLASTQSGWLLTHSITRRSDGVEPKNLPMVIDKAGEVNEAVASIFDDGDVFGTFEDTYRGASLCTYKETG